MAKFDYFVVLAAMRTGSNFLESNLNQFAGLTCHGEAFNPGFIGYPQVDNILGVTLEDREVNPQRLIDAIKQDADLGGFRFFQGHDPRVLDISLDDPRCAKIILTRNPVDSFVSWKIAQATGQWKLTNATHAKTEQITFDPTEFDTYLGGLETFQTQVMRRLQTSGQTAFHLTYDDLHDLDIINGIAAFLGIDERLGSLDRKLKKQNPKSLSEKVSNFAEMEQALGQLDRFNLNSVPYFEPRRGPGIPAYVAATRAGLLYMPLRSGPDHAVLDWLAALDGATPEDLVTGFTQKSLREWMAMHPGHRRFAVLRHPVARAHSAFCARILFDGPDMFPQIRANLRKVHKLPIPREPVQRGKMGKYDLAAHHAAFMSFLRFLEANLSSQTGIRVDPSWASQLTILQGMAQFALPDVILREDHLQVDLAHLAAQIGVAPMPVSASTDPDAALLSQIHDREIAAAARQAYARDYEIFGFRDWSA